MRFLDENGGGPGARLRSGTRRRAARLSVSLWRHERCPNLRVSSGPAALRLRLGAARPIELVIEANDDRVEIGVYADRGNRNEIVVFGAEVVEVILDLGGDIFDQPKLDAGADGKPASVNVGDLCSSSDSGWGEKIISVGNAHPGAARLGVEQPVVRGIAEAPSRGCKPLRVRREPFLRGGCCFGRTC